MSRMQYLLFPTKLPATMEQWKLLNQSLVGHFGARGWNIADVSVLSGGDLLFTFEQTQPIIPEGAVTLAATTAARAAPEDSESADPGSEDEEFEALVALVPPTLASRLTGDGRSATRRTTKKSAKKTAKKSPKKRVGRG